MNSSNLHLKEIGSGDNILVLLHAYPVNSDLFLKLDNFLPAGWMAILPDFPGFGNSSIYNDQSTLTMEQLAEHVYQLLPEAYDEVVIGGVSMGGYVSMAFAELYPDLASGYILMNTRDTADADGGAGRKEVVKRMELGERELYIKDLLPKLLGKTSLSKNKMIDEVLDLISSTSDEAIIQTSRGMGLRPDRSELMTSLGKPILLITGNEDVITGPTIMKEMHDNYPLSNFVVISDAGHYAVFEQPKSVSEEIRQFLSNM